MCDEQVLALTTHIEGGFQNKLKTSGALLTLLLRIQYCLERATYLQTPTYYQ